MSHYDTLNIKKDATEAEIKKAFKKLALQHHPDRGGDKEKFQELQKAYDTLVDHDLREEYDDSLNGRTRNIFDMFFNNRANRKQQMPKGKDINFHLWIDLEHAFVGATKKIKITRKVICESCDGIGTPSQEGKTSCSHCDGTGNISILQHMGFMQIMQQHPCMYCQQKGYTILPEHYCSTCTGSGTVSRTENIDIPIRKGSKDGEIIVFQGMADEMPDTIPGDVLVFVKIKTHNVFTRQGDDLYIIKELNLYEALKGYDFTIKQLDGSNLCIQHTGTTQPETISSIDGKGMPIVDTNSRGKLLIHFKVILSENIPTNIINMLKDLK